MTSVAESSTVSRGDEQEAARAVILRLLSSGAERVAPASVLREASRDGDEGAAARALLELVASREVFVDAQGFLHPAGAALVGQPVIEP